MWKITSKEINHTYNEKRLNNRQRNIIRVLGLLVSIIVLLGIGGFVAYNAGFVPINEFLEVQKPAGTAVELNAGKFMDECPEFENIPNLDKIKYKIYGINESISSVVTEYKQKLEKDGYSVKYNGTVHAGEMSFQYYGFLKGITAVGIIMTSDANRISGYETVVLYTIGNVFDYKEIIDWYRRS